MPYMSKYHPWRILRDQYPGISVYCTRELPGTGAGQWTDDGLDLCSSLDQGERRCTLTHEIVHLERGPVPADPYLAQKEERVVDCITACRLIDVASLVDALVWSHGNVNAETADELWVDLPTLTNRVQHLKPCERRRINEELERRQL